LKPGLIDRFGPLPEQAIELTNVIRLRWIAEKLGIEKLILKNGRMIAYFVSNPASDYYRSKAFTSMLDFVKHHSNCSLKEDKQKLTLTIRNITDVESAVQVLQQVTMAEKAIH
jgi:transcription-repair coupling factor (superfamily II helicase)